MQILARLDDRTSQGKQMGAMPLPEETPDSAVTDEALIALIGQGDRDAFDALYRRHYPMLARFVRRVTRREDVIEEAVNDTMLAVWRGAANFSYKSKVSTWLIAILYRVAAKSAGRAARHDAGDIVSDDLAHDAPGPEQTVDGQQQFTLVKAAIDQLSPVQRAVIELTFFHELGYREIAEILECPVDTVKTRMFHARARLRQILGDAVEPSGDRTAQNIKTDQRDAAAIGTGQQGSRK